MTVSLTSIPTFYRVFYLNIELFSYSLSLSGPAVPAAIVPSPVEVRRCPLGSGVGSLSWQLRSGDVHCDHELAWREENEEKKDEEEELKRSNL